MREPVLARLRPVDMNPLDGIPESVQQLPLQLAGLFHSGLKISYRRLCSHTGPDNRGNIFCASAEIVLLHATVDQWLDLGATMPVKHAHSLRPMKTMRRQRDEVRPEFLRVQRQPAAAERGIDEKRDAPFAREFGCLGDRLNRAKVVVAVVQADDRGVVAQRLAKRRRIKPPLVIHGQLRALKSLFFKPSDGTQHSRVFD